MALPQLQKDFRDADTQDFLSQFRTKKDGKYTINNYKYPLEIGTMEDLQHFVSFFINIRGKSKFRNTTGVNNEKSTVLEDVVVGQGQNRIDPVRLSEKAGGPGLGTTAVGRGAVEAVGASAILSGILRPNPASITRDLGTGLGVAGAALVGSEVLENLGVLEPDQLKRISDVVTLHIQEKPTTNYGAVYREKDLGSLVGMAAGGTSATDLNGVRGSLGAGEVSAAIATSILNTVSARAGEVIEFGLKQKLNPFKEQFFENVDFRTFNFRHTFMPKSLEEAQNVKRIINLFKFHMHPELSAGGLFYIYPSEFEIKYFYRDKENTYFDKISSCVLEDMTVEYGGDIFSTFEDGKPVEVNMVLKFKELELLHKDRIAQGY